jgi:pimeloyl-ACP methyl ester carboxylesterase
MGHRIFVPSLTGLGERLHLSSGSVNLDTHIADAAGVIEAEGLQEIDLVGHSYGGMVITGVADRFASRIRSLVYLDAFLPSNGQSVLDLLGPKIALANLAMAGESQGLFVPPIARNTTRVPEHLKRYVAFRSPQPFATMVQKINLSGSYETITKRLYVSAQVEQSAVFADTYSRIKGDHTWSSLEIPCGHMMQLEMPEETARMIHEFTA